MILLYRGDLQSSLFLIKSANLWRTVYNDGNTSRYTEQGRQGIAPHLTYSFMGKLLQNFEHIKSRNKNKASPPAREVGLQPQKNWRQNPPVVQLAPTEKGCTITSGQPLKKSRVYLPKGVACFHSLGLCTTQSSASKLAGHICKYLHQG